MRTHQIDCYGFDAASSDFKRKRLEAYLLRIVNGVLYFCFSDAPTGPIHRLDHNPNGEIRRMWAYGAWANAAELDYIPINETRNVPQED